MMASFGMTKEDKAQLTNNRVYLVGQVSRLDHILDHLLQEGIFSQYEINDIKALNNEHRIRETLTWLPKKGPDAFGAFIHALMKTGQRHVAKTIDNRGLVEQWLAESNPPCSNPIPVSTSISDHFSSGDTSFPTREHQSIQTEPKEVITSDIMDCNILPADVTVAKELLKDCENVYKLTKSNRGQALIINNYKFSEGEYNDRKGADYDAVNLRKLFEALNFRVYTKSNKTAEDIKKIIKDTASDDELNKSSQCFILFVLSHGGRDRYNTEYILGSDSCRVYTRRDIIHPFHGTFHGKPKLFFFQACRNRITTGTDFGVTARGGNDDITDGDLEDGLNSLSLNGPSQISDMDDIFTIYSTQPGQDSSHHNTLGSPFVRYLVEVISNYAHTDSLLQMLLKLNLRMMKNVNMVPEVHFTAGKQLYFFPKYQE